MRGPMRLLPCLFAVALLASAVLAADHGGSMETWGDVYPEGDPAIHGWFRGTYAFHAEPRPWLFARIVVHLEADSHGEISRDRLYDDDDRDRVRAASRFRDLALGFKAGDLTIVAGKQRLTWARASFVNAADNLTPRDWTDPLDEVRLSPWALDATWERGRWSAEGALVPRYAPSRLPQLGSRWLVPDADDLGLRWLDTDFPAVTWRNVQAGIRGGFRGSRGEARVSLYRGFDDAPHVTQAGPLLVPRYAALDASAIDGEVLAGAWVFRGEAGYFHFHDGSDGYGLFEVEAEWSRAAWRVIAAYADAVGGDPGSGIPAALDQGSLPGIFLRAGYGEATEWQVALDTVVGTKDGDSLVRLSGSYPWAGHVRAGLEVAVMSGGAATFWGRWRDNDRARAFLKIDF